MSLLLDALKKAAEQKAEKSKQEAEPKPPGDETVIDSAPEDLAALDADDETAVQVQRRDVQDETELDEAEMEARYERTRAEYKTGDETDIDAPEQTDTRIPEAAAQMETGEDETIIFADDDVSEFMGDPTYINHGARQAEDETDLSQAVAAEDQTGFEAPATPPRDDETELSQLAQREDATDLREPPAGEDQTDISIPPPLADEIVYGKAGAGSVSEDTDLSRIQEPDDTDLSQQRPQAGEDTDLSQQRPQAGEDTDLSQRRPQAGEDTDLSHLQVRAGEETDLGAAEDVAADEPGGQEASVEDPEPSEPQDLSLLLNDADPTGHTTRTSPTDPRIPGGLPDAGDGELGLVDTTQHRAPADQTAATEATTEAAAGATATTGMRLDTLTTEGTTTRAESTATRTYAPDNYDRTLMKLPTDDASKLFAGMKSDGDVVMTPDYAKKVFQSKSSAQRVQHLKVYSGIFLLLLVAVSVYGVFEFSSQNDAIEASLRPLKRDPLPGIIQQQQERDTQLFTETGEVSQQTLDIVESAEGEVEAAVASQGVIAGGEESAAVSATTEESAAETESSETVAAVVETPATEPEAGGDSIAGLAATVDTPSESNTAAADTGVIASLDSEPAAAAQPADAGGSLEIITSSRLDQRQVKLREAYTAYQAGNDARALELYSEVLQEDPGNRNALLGRAAIYVQNGNAAGAVDDYQALLLSNPKDSLAMTSLISVANLSPQESESRLKLMIREEPESPYLNFALGNAYGAQNRWLEAQGSYFTALQYNPEDPNYAYNLAVSLEHIEQPQAAMTYYRRALENIDNGLATFSKDVVDQRLEVLGRL